MKKLGLLGKNISHSKSKLMYEDILKREVQYSLFDYDDPEMIPKLSEFFNNIEGLSVTSPYKKHFLNHVSIDENVKDLRVINCIKKVGNEFLATNTDFLAVKELVQQFDYETIVLLGSGAMARITTQIFDDLNLKYTQYSRSKNGDISSLDLTSFKKCLIINSCSRDFIFKGKVPKDSIFWDYNYNNSAQEENISSSRYVDGLSLLRLQAVYALEFWNKLDIPD